MVNFLGQCSVPILNVQILPRRHVDILILEGQYTVLPQNIRIQLPSDTVTYPERTELFKMEDPIVQRRRGTSLKNLAVTYTTAEASDSCCVLLFCVALLMQGCFHKSFRHILFQYAYFYKYSIYGRDVVT
jgi:hypothetical protein